MENRDRLAWARIHASEIDALIAERPTDTSMSSVIFYRSMFVCGDGELVSAMIGVPSRGDNVWVQSQRRASPYGAFSFQRLTGLEVAGADVVAFLGLDTVEPDSLEWTQLKPSGHIAVIRDAGALIRNGS